MTMIHQEYARLVSQAHETHDSDIKDIKAQNSQEPQIKQRGRFTRFLTMSALTLVVAFASTSFTLDYNRMLGDSMAQSIDNASFALTKHSIFKPTAQYREFLLNKTMKEHPIKSAYLNWPANYESEKEAIARVHIIRDLRAEGVFKDEAKFNKVYHDLKLSIDKSYLIKEDNQKAFDIEKNAAGIATVRENIEDVRFRLFTKDRAKVDPASSEYQAKYK